MTQQLDENGNKSLIHAFREGKPCTCDRPNCNLLALFVLEAVEVMKRTEEGRKMFSRAYTISSQEQEELEIADLINKGLWAMDGEGSIDLTWQLNEWITK